MLTTTLQLIMGEIEAKISSLQLPSLLILYKRCCYNFLSIMSFDKDITEEAGPGNSVININYWDVTLSRLTRLAGVALGKTLKRLDAIVGYHLLNRKDGYDLGKKLSWLLIDTY
jgi:hypothetical protein